MTDANNPPPGWYPDPTGSPGQRYWDGNTWTEQTQGAEPAAAAPAAAPTTPSFQPTYSTGAPMGASAATGSGGTSKGLLIAMIGAGVFLVSLIMPWLSAEALGDSESSNGLAGDIPWMVLGPSIDELILGDEGTSDMLLIAPLIIVAGVMALVLFRGGVSDKRSTFSIAITALGAITAVLVLLEWNAINSEVSDLEDFANEQGVDISVSIGFGLYLAFLAAVAVAIGGVLAMRDAKAEV